MRRHYHSPICVLSILLLRFKKIIVDLCFPTLYFQFSYWDSTIKRNWKYMVWFKLSILLLRFNTIYDAVNWLRKVLSILLLRFSTDQFLCFLTSLNCPSTFNSLIEIPRYGYEHCKDSVSPLSILLLRFSTGYICSSSSGSLRADLSILLLRFLHLFHLTKRNGFIVLSILLLRFWGGVGGGPQQIECFQFSYWDSLEQCCRCIKPTHNCFQFSYWDSYAVIMVGRWKSKKLHYLSILLLRFLYRINQFKLNHLSNISFNSLIEILEATAQLTISPQVFSFNSLIEIQLPKLRCGLCRKFHTFQFSYWDSEFVSGRIASLFKCFQFSYWDSSSRKSNTCGGTSTSGTSFQFSYWDS
jgi:hypothetical protein